jgi:predicted RNase H-like nuclease (RuvC/YqgF family)
MLKIQGAKLLVVQEELDTQQKEHAGNTSTSEREIELKGELEDVQREALELKNELQSLTNEKAGNFNQYKLLYGREIEALGKQFKAEVEKAAQIKARTNATARVQEYGRIIKVLKGENNDLVSLSVAIGVPHAELYSLIARTNETHER